MITPCKQCIGLVVCRHKSYAKLFDDCDIIKDYIPNHTAMDLRDEDKVTLLSHTLQATKWRYDGFYVDSSRSRNKYR